MDTDVVVVGAGAAGLAAAISLAERSIRVVAVDGRDRIGGRVRWETVGSVDVPAELGAEFIHGHAPETSAYLRDAGLSKVETGDDSWICRPGVSLEPEDDDAFSENALFDRVSSLAEDESVDTFLARFENEPALQRQARRARAFVEGFEAADPALASIRAINDEIRTGVDSMATRPVGSYAPLFSALEARCARAGVDVRLATVVARIRWEPGGAAIEMHSAGGDAVTVRARCVVVTVPVGVLQVRGEAGLAFDPPLPPEKSAAIRGLEMGHATRVTLAFRTAFWEHIAGGRYRDASFFRCDGGAFNAFWTQVPIRTRTIVAWLGGPRAVAFGALPAQEQIARARDEFGDMLGERALAIREFEAGVTYDWTADPFARGAYSYVKTGAATARADLAAPVGDVLFFAGEATATDGQGGTVSGAFATGLRAAREVAHVLQIADARSPAGP